MFQLFYIEKSVYLKAIANQKGQSKPVCFSWIYYYYRQIDLRFNFKYHDRFTFTRTIKIKITDPRKYCYVESINLVALSWSIGQTKVK